MRILCFHVDSLPVSVRVAGETIELRSGEYVPDGGRGFRFRVLHAEQSSRRAAPLRFPVIAASDEELVKMLRLGVPIASDFCAEPEVRQIIDDLIAAGVARTLDPNAGLGISRFVHGALNGSRPPG